MSEDNNHRYGGGEDYRSAPTRRPSRFPSPGEDLRSSGRGEDLQGVVRREKPPASPRMETKSGGDLGALRAEVEGLERQADDAERQNLLKRKQDAERRLRDLGRGPK